MITNKVIGHLISVVETPDLVKYGYKIGKKIGMGGMGSVFLGEDLKLERTVAIKLLDIPDLPGELKERTINEAKIIAKLDHSGIVPVHDAGYLEDGRVFFVMKYVSGKHLGDFVNTLDSLSEILELFINICEIVGFAHKYKIVHRDLKPDNILINDKSEVFVMDWGIAKILIPGNKRDHKESDVNFIEQTENINDDVDDRTKFGMILGTKGFMAPEQERGENNKIDERTDIFALGSLLNYMILGNKPLELNEKIQQDDNITKSKYKFTEPLKIIYQKAISEEKENRYQSTSELIADVSRYVVGLPISSQNSGLLKIIKTIFNK